jgi:hypothetical protein
MFACRVAEQTNIDTAYFKYLPRESKTILVAFTKLWTADGFW